MSKQRPLLAFVVAMDKNRLIGADNRLPWRLPDDMKWFRQVTLGKPVIMGRKTYESIPPKFRPLPERVNVVVTRQLDYVAEGAIVVHSIAEALTAVAPQPEIIIAGGSQLYEQLLPQADRLYLTLVDGEFGGDAYFPAFDWDDWQEISRERHPSDGRHAVPFDWLILDRK